VSQIYRKIFRENGLKFCERVLSMECHGNHRKVGRRLAADLHVVRESGRVDRNKERWTTYLCSVIFTAQVESLDEIDYRPFLRVKMFFTGTELDKKCNLILKRRVAPKVVHALAKKL
jgi:hypothetical protein